MRLLLLGLLLAACTGQWRPRPEFVVHREPLSRPGEEIARLSEARKITSRGALLLTRGDLTSPFIYARAAVVGPEGICWESATPAASFWTGIRVTSAGTTEEISGTADELRSWLLGHVAKRPPAGTYLVHTKLGWHEQSAASLVALALERTTGRALVGYRWAEVESVEYHRMLRAANVSDFEVDRAIADNDFFVRYAIEKHEGLPPGPCPLVDAGQPLLARDTRW
jgi:hypothetical protein